MKKSISVIGILLLSFLLHGGEINYFSGTWNETIAKAKAENKIVMLDCYTDWCSWCKVMDKSTFTNDTVLEELSKNFIACHREMEKDPEGLMLSMKYHIQGFPTFLFFSGTGKLIYQVVGYRQTADFLSELKKARDPKSQINYSGFSSSLEPGFPDFYKNSFGTSQVRVMPKRDTVLSFLDKQKDITSEVSWAVIWRFPVNEKYANEVLANAAKLRELYGDGQVNQKIVGIVSAKVDTAISRNDEKSFAENVNSIDKYVPGDNSPMKIFWRQKFYEKNNQWSQLADMEQTLMDTAKLSTISGYMNGISWEFYEKCDDVKICERTLPWMKKVTDANPEYPSMDTYACLLYKTGHYKEAKEVAIKAIELGKASGDKTDSTEKLLLDIDAKLK